MGRTRKWGEIETQLNLVGLTSNQLSLPLELPHPDELHYRVPSNVQLLVDQQIKWLVWDDIDHAKSNNAITRAVLPGFVRLASAEDSALLEFAREWGPLGDGWRRAVPHEFPAFPRSIGELVRVGGATHKVFEPAEAWRRLARQVEALLRLAAHLQRGQMTSWLGPTAGRWEVITSADPKRAQYECCIDELTADRPLATAWESPTSAEVLGLQRNAVARILHVWLKFGDVQLVPYWDAVLTRMVVRVDFDRSAGLHGRIALEIASALTSPFGIVQCAGCGYPYAPEKRRPRR
jgi:hypothetical protein